MQIHIQRDGEEFGPYSEEEVRQYLREGSLLPKDLAWHEGLENWVALSQLVPELPEKRTPPPPRIAASTQSDKTVSQAKPHLKKRASTLAKIGLFLFMMLIGAVAWPFMVRWQIDQEIASSTREIELDPNNSNAYYMRGENYEQKHDYDKAIADFDAALKIDPNARLAAFGRNRVTKEKADNASGGGSLVTPSTSNNNGELTRELAAQLLNQYLAHSNTSRLLFTPKGLIQAKADGLIIDITNSYQGYIFTDKGFAIVQGFAVHNTTEPLSGGLGGIPIKYISSNENVSLILYRDQDTDPSFPLTSPIAEHVSEVTGISAGPFGNNMMAVEYITVYQIPSANQAILPYIYSGRRATTTFQKYDDGWRVSENRN